MRWGVAQVDYTPCFRMMTRIACMYLSWSLSLVDSNSLLLFLPPSPSFFRQQDLSPDVPRCCLILRFLYWGSCTSFFFGDTVERLIRNAALGRREVGRREYGGGKEFGRDYTRHALTG